MPLIEKFLFAGFKVIIAGEGDQKILLQTIFPALEIVELKGYRISYSSTKYKTIFKLFFQIPKILMAINGENKWLNRLINEKHLDIVVSDNRFGLHNKAIISIFITHQLLIKTSLGRYADEIIQKLNYYFINQFDYCWVPDREGAGNLAGELSHPTVKPVTRLLYTGSLSAIKKDPAASPHHKLLLLLSGPEPQRTIFENILLAQLKDYANQVVLVRGLPGATTVVAAPSSVTVYNYLSGAQLQTMINSAEIIVSRSGYSTIMDLLPLGKKCIVIPTPGQAEQQYLATWLSGQNYVCTGDQDNFSLLQLLAKAEKLQIPDLSFLREEIKSTEAINMLMRLLEEKT